MSLGVVGGTLIASALKGLFDIGSTIASNRYNRPQAQMRRLRKAGLPLSYMYEGKVATQSGVPELSIDPNLGTLPQTQAEKLRADTTGQEIQNQKDQNELDWLEKLSGDGSGTTNQEQKLEFELATKEAESFIKKHEQELKQIELWVENNAFEEGISMEMKREALKKAAQMVKNLIAQAGLMDQLKDIRAFEEKLNNSLTQDLESLPDWISSLLKIILIATKRR